jgi:hypothetical protein
LKKSTVKYYLLRWIYYYILSALIKRWISTFFNSHTAYLSLINLIHIYISS